MLASALRHAGNVALDLLLPPSCMGCGDRTDGPFRLCAACFGRCHFITAPFCRCCGVPFAYAAQAGTNGNCQSCLDHPRAFDTARGALTYDDHSRPLLLQFKHADRTELAGLFAPMLLRAGAQMLAAADLLVPVPLHKTRLRQRGYNQAALLAGVLARPSRVPALPDALERARKTPSMGQLSAAARAALMQGAIRVRPRHAAAIENRHVVLVDDVMTSGATAQACAGALHAAGARRIDVLVVARVPQPGL